MQGRGGPRCVGEIVSIGAPVSPAATQTINPFDHPRILIADYAAAERLMQYVVKTLAGQRWLASSPVIVLHPDVELAGGLADIENRALQELAEAAGARRVTVHYGRTLTDQEAAEL